MKVLRLLVAVTLVSVPSFVPATGQEQQADSSRAANEGFVLKTAETLEFTTDEVTWPSLDVSPDGRTILFDVLGDLYTLPIEGGTATRIMGGLSFESQPAYSPDGKTIAFLTDRTGVENLWIANADGSNPRAVSKDQKTNDRPQIMVSPAWTPDGQYIVVSKSRPPEPGTFGLFMYHRDGGTGVRIGPAPPPQPGPDAQGPPPPPPTNKMGAVVSPDGRFIYYAQRNGTFTYNAQFPLWQVYRHDRETGDASQVTNARGSAMRPVISPDGKWMVYGTRHKTQTGLRVRNLETGAERWLAYPVTRDDQESRASRDTLPRYDFMPDGQSLIVPIGGKIHRVDFATGESRVIPMSVNVQAEIAPRVYTPVRVEDGDTVRARLIRWPTLSPDGKRLVFGAMNRLYIMDLPERHAAAADVGAGTAQAPRAPSEGEFMPTWSPDGQSHRLRDVDDDRRSHQAGRGQRRRAADADDRRRLLPRSGVHARRLAHRVHSRRGGRSALFDPARHAGAGRRSRRAVARSAASIRRTRSSCARCRQPAAPRRSSPRRKADARRISSATIRPPRLSRRQSRSAVDHDGRLRPPHALPRHGHRSRQQSAVSATRSACRPTAPARSSACRAGISSSRCRWPDARPSTSASPAAATTPPCRSSACPPKAATTCSGRATARAVTWAWGAQFFQQPIDANEPQKTDVTVDDAARRAPRARCCSPARASSR